jgi:type VI secretion system protein ImpA
MASNGLLDFEALLAPIPGDAPSGTAIPFETKQKLEEDRKEINPEDFAPNDPDRPKTAKKADWVAIERRAKEALIKNSKDLLLAARLTESLTRQKEKGFAGLRDGLRLMREMVEQCWDRLYPAIEDGDLEVRAGPFNWLDDPEKGARFPMAIRMVPLVGAEGLPSYGWLDWKTSLEGKGPISKEGFDKVRRAASFEDCQKVEKAIAESKEEIAKLLAVLNKKMGPVAPGLTGLRQALDECHALIKEILSEKRPAEPEKGNIPAGAKPGASGVSPKAMATRADVYQQLNQAAALLKEMEPHSPIPYLILRAVELGAMAFPELIKELVREQKIVSDLNRELGIKEAPQKKAEAK